MNINFLRIPLYKLFYIDNLEEFTGLTADELASVKDEYDESTIKGIVESVEWATHNPEYDFASLLPDLKYSNDVIFKYLCKMNNSFSNL